MVECKGRSNVKGGRMKKEKGSDRQLKLKGIRLRVKPIKKKKIQATMKIESHPRGIEEKIEKRRIYIACNVDTTL